MDTEKENSFKAKKQDDKRVRPVLLRLLYFIPGL